MLGGVLWLNHIPPAPLSAFVERMWLYEAPARTFAKERMMPRPGATLIVNLAEDEVRNYTGDQLDQVQRLPGAAITAAQWESFVIDTAEQTHVMGIEFFPGGSWPFFAPATDELSNRHTALKDLWGVRAEDIRAQLLDASSPRQKFAVLESALLQCVARPMQVDACVASAIKVLSAAPQQQTIAALTARLGISSRKFSRLFTQQVGLKPKTFARLQRFQQVLNQVGLGCDIDWAGVIAQCGYYDQAHFIHDFRNFSGFTPTEYVQSAKLDIRHVPLS